MRKILLPFITVLFFSAIGHAQIKKGSIFLGGDITASTQKTEYETGTGIKSKLLGISPVFGKFVKDNLVVGGNISFLINDNESDIVSDNKTTGYGAGVFVRKYKNIGGSGFYIFGQAGLNAGYTEQKTDAPINSFDDKIKITTIGINAYPGISFAVSKKFHLETGFNNLISLSYLNEKRNDNSPNTTGYTSKGFSLNTSLSNATSSLYVGFRVLLSK